MIRPSAVLSSHLFLAAAPLIFVVLWSTGHIFTKFGLPYAEPATFLTLRFSCGAILLIAIAAISRAPWPTSLTMTRHIVVAGLLIHGFYLIGVFTSIERGVATGTLAVILGLQPLLTAVVVGRVLGETVSARQWLGLVLGFLGVGLVVWRKLSIAEGTVEGFALAAFCLLSITAGAIYQKRYCADMDLRTGAAIQQVASAVLIGALALTFEMRAVEWTGEFVFALGWLVIVLTVVTFNLLFYLLRIGEAAKVTSMFYLTPPVTAVMGYFMFGEMLGVLALVGMAVAVIGFAMASR